MKKIFIISMFICILGLFGAKAQDFNVCNWQLLGYSSNESEMEEIPGTVYATMDATDSVVIFAVVDGSDEINDENILDLYALYDMSYEGQIEIEGVDFDAFMADVIMLPLEAEAQAMFLLNHDGDMDFIQIMLPDGSNELYMAQQNNPYALTYFLKLSEFLQDDTNPTPIARRLINAF